MKRMTKAKRRFLLAVATGTVCDGCRSAPGDEERECGPCRVKRVDSDPGHGAYVQHIYGGWVPYADPQ